MNKFLDGITFEMYRDPISRRDPTLNLHENVRIAQSHHDQPFATRLLWFYSMMHNKAPWDYKQLGRRYENFGNFHYGLIGAAAGIPKDVLRRFAGWAGQIADSHRHPELGLPFGPTGMSYNCGDNPNDAPSIAARCNAYARDFEPGQ